MTRFGLLFGACLASAGLAFIPAAHAEGNGLARGKGPNHIGTFPGSQAAVRALLAVLHQRLAITSAQESAWQAFADAVATQASDADGSLAQAGAVHGAVDALNLQATLLRKQADDAAAVAHAFSALYAVLTPAQRAIADDYFKEGFAL